MIKSLIIATILIYNSQVLSPKKENIRGVKVSQKVAKLSAEGKVSGYETSTVNLYYSKSSHLYHLNYLFDSYHNDVHIISENREHYIYHETDSSFGYDYDVKKSPQTRIVSMDSVRNGEWALRIDVYNIFTKARTKLVSSKKDTRTGSLVETYNYQGIEDSTMTGTCFLTYTNNLKGIEYSLCKELDNKKNQRLQHVRIIKDAWYLKAANIYLEKRETTYSVEEISQSDTKQLETYFNMFSKK